MKYHISHHVLHASQLSNYINEILQVWLLWQVFNDYFKTSFFFFFFGGGGGVIRMENKCSKLWAFKQNN